MLPYAELDAISGAIPDFPTATPGLPKVESKVLEQRKRLKDIEDRLMSLRNSQFRNDADPKEQSRVAFHTQRRAVLCAAVANIHIRHAMLASDEHVELLRRLTEAKKEFWYAVLWNRADFSPLFQYLWCDSLIDFVPAPEDPADLIVRGHDLCPRSGQFFSH